MAKEAPSGAHATGASGESSRVILIRALKAGASGYVLKTQADTDLLAAIRAVERGEMVATVKIIPFAVSGTMIDQAIAAFHHKPLVEIKPFRKMKIAAISTVLPGLKPSVINKTLAVLEGRIAPSGSTVDADQRVPHDADDVAQIGRAHV